MPRNLKTPPPSSVVHQLCGTPDLLVGVALVIHGLACFVPSLWILGVLWTCLLAPLFWLRFRLRLLHSGVGYRPLPAARLMVPALLGAAALLVLSAVSVAWFRGPIPEMFQQHPMVTSAYAWIVGLTGLLVAASLRWLRWFAYSTVLLLVNLTPFLGVAEGWPFLATGLLMTACGLYSFRRYARRHPELLRP
jgi:hypothetical protein